MKRVSLNINTIEDLKSFEHVSPRVSEKYVPIFTSEIAELLHPEFKFVNGKRFVQGLTKHYINMVSKKATIRIFNSYDRTMALSVRLVADDGFSIDLGLDRIVHIGSKAQHVVEDLKSQKDEIIKNIDVAKSIIAQLSETRVRGNLAKKISDVIFESEKNKKGFEAYHNPIDLFDKDLSVKDYIVRSTKVFINGTYTITADGKKRNGRKHRSILKKISIENNIMKLLKEEYPAILL